MFPKISGIVYPFAFFSLVVFIFMLIPNRQDASTIRTSAHSKNAEKTIPLQKAVEYRGDYIVFRNYVQANRQFKYSESVTLSVPADYRFLDNILPLVDRWRGPISVALYAPGYDFFSTLQSIAYLRTCSPKQMVKEFVTFHLFFEHKHIPIQIDRTSPDFVTSHEYSGTYGLVTFNQEIDIKVRNEEEMDSNQEIIVIPDKEGKYANCNKKTDDMLKEIESLKKLLGHLKSKNLISRGANDHLMHYPPLLDFYQDGFDCSQRPPYETVKDGDMYKDRMNLTYPINVARNVAKLAAQTHFVFPSDIELYPTRNFIKEFLHFVEKRPEYFLSNSTNVFVLPLFEILEDYKLPETKKELGEMIRNETAITFHQKVCKVCHKIPRLDDWIKDDQKKGLDVFTIAKRQNEQVIWEPFFVCTQKEPLWDERLNWEGQGNKMCQAYYLCMLDYDFIVLDNAFLIHKPGVKKKKVQNIKHKDQQAKNDAILRSIQEEITRIYGKNDKCLIHNVFQKATVGV